jgi:acetyl esterase/lipase
MMRFYRARLMPSAVLCCVVFGVAVSYAYAQAEDETLHRRMDRLEATVTLAEDMRALKRLQRAYGYYLDKGMWQDLSELFAEDAIARYPTGTYIGADSIRRHLFMNVGGQELGANGLGDNRLYNHMNIQPVVHIAPNGGNANGRWRALAYFGSLGGNAVWAEGVYEMGYVKQGGVWKIATLTYHSGFSAPYATGWVLPESAADGSTPPVRGPRNLPHPADEPRNMPCEGFPAACVPPFHYENPSVANAGSAWLEPAEVPRQYNRGDAYERAAALARRAAVLVDEQDIENLQRIYGYYLDRRMWDQVADLFADDATIEMDMRGVYLGRERIREFLNLLGPDGLDEGQLNDHVQLQIIVDVAADGRTAKSRSREFDMLGELNVGGTWSDGVYTNTFVKQDGVWKIQSLRYYPTLITDYDKGWGEDAQPVPRVSRELPPDRPPSDDYEIYPRAHIPPYHYVNPVTGLPPRYPDGAGEPSRRAIRAATVQPEVEPLRPVVDIDAALSSAERDVIRAKDYHELENLESVYGYYLDKNLWNDLADLFAVEGTMELAQRGVYRGRERVREFLFNVFGAEGPVEGRLGNHIQMQPVIHVAADGQSAAVRARMLQQLTFGPRASMGAAVYENEFVKENGVWKFSALHALNTWGAGYDGGWARSPGGRVPGPSATYPPDEPPTLEFAMYPAVYELPFHYDNPVSGRRSNTKDFAALSRQRSFDGYMPPEIARELRAIGPEIETEKTGALYRDQHPREPYTGVQVTRDVAYGRDPRNKLDIFTSGAAGAPKPVLVFVSGGGFRRGSKRADDSPFYDNVMLWAAREGLVGVNVNYRLAPEHTWPSGIEDVDGIVRWIRAHAAEYGGDGSQVVLWGHSAGAAHVADYIAARARAGADDGLAGAVLLSGFYDLGRSVSVWSAYYGDDVATYEARSSLPGLLLTDTPLFVVDAELDPEMFQAQAQLLTQARQAAGMPVRRLHLAGHSHLSEGYAVGTSDRSLSDPVLGFVNSSIASR